MNNELIEQVSIKDVLSEKTTSRPEIRNIDRSEDPDFVPETEDDSSESKADFAPFPEKKEVIPEPTLEEEEEEFEEFDPEESAENLINLIDVGQQTLFLPLASVKLMKNYGGKERVKEMKVAYVKKHSGDELDAEEEKLASLYKSYKSSLKELKEEIPFQKEDINLLRPPTAQYCKKKELKVNEDLSFWAAITKVMTSRVAEILTS